MRSLSSAHPQSVRTFALTIIMIGSAALFIGATAWQLIVSGPFDWHIAQPQSWQGGIEGLALCACLALGFLRNRARAAIVLIAIPALLYARRHAFDVPLAIDLIYLEIVVGLGFLVRRLSGVNVNPGLVDYLYAFATGFAVWSVCAWTASALDLGSIRELRWLTLLLGLAAVFGTQRPLCAHLVQRVRSASASTRLWSGLLAGWLLILYARTKYALGYDALWYGLQAERVLVPNSSIYEPLGLVSPVHYYPKVFEMWLLPLSAAGDSSILSGISILMLLLVLLACRHLMQEFRVPDFAQMPTLGLIATLPALANISGQPKPDTFAALFVLLAVIASIRFIRSGALESVAWMLTTIAIACCAKLSAIPYLGVLIVCVGAASWQARRRRLEHRSDALRLAIVTLTLSMCVAMFATARTWLLAGVPTIGPDPLLKLWHTLGFVLREPAGTLDWALPQDWSDVPQLLIDALFRPQKLEHIVINWTGNVWLWLLAIALVMKASPWRRIDAPRLGEMMPMISLAACGLGLFVSIRYLVRGGDGNYFVFAAVPAIVLASTSVSRHLARLPVLRAAMLACISSFVIFQASYSFLSGQWRPGTRAFDGKFSLSWKGSRRSDARILESEGISEISDHLKAVTGLPRAIGLVGESVMFRIPARYENLSLISYSRPEYFANSRSLLGFMHEQKILYLILPSNDTGAASMPLTPAVAAAASAMQGVPSSRTISDRNYLMVDSSHVSDAEWQRILNPQRDTHPNVEPARQH